MPNKLSNFLFIFCLFLFHPLANAVERIEVLPYDLNENESLSRFNISGDGRIVAFTLNALIRDGTSAYETSDLYVHDRNTGTTRQIDRGYDGGEKQGRGTGTYEFNISADGRFVVFESYATNLVVNDTNNLIDIFVHDLETRQTSRVNISADKQQSNGGSGGAYISATGHYVVFSSGASNLVPGDSNIQSDVFVHDRHTGLNQLVSVSSSGTQGNSFSFGPSISDDGRYVAFASNANNLVEGDTYNVNDLFVHDVLTAETRRITVSSRGIQSNAHTGFPQISAEGNVVVFNSTASNLVDNDTNNFNDGFLYDVELGTLERISVSASGQQANGPSGIGNGRSGSGVSADGRFILIATSATNLIDGRNDSDQGILIHDRELGVTRRINLIPGGLQPNGDIGQRTISADGKYIAFKSDANNLVAGDDNDQDDIFIVENEFANTGAEFSVAVRPTSSVATVGEYTRFQAHLTNNGNETLTNCRADIINPLINWKREFSYFSWPLGVTNPALNGAIDIAPGQTGKIQLTVLPRMVMRKQVKFEYTCDNGRAVTIPFINTVHLTAKTAPYISEDHVQIINGNNKTHLEIDTTNGKYWTSYVVILTNTGFSPSRISLETTTDIPVTAMRQPVLCEPINPVDGTDWSCARPRANQIQVELSAGMSKKILVFVHARQAIKSKPVDNRIVVEVRDNAGDVVSKHSIGVSAIN